METETVTCIACGGGHCDDEVRCRTGPGAEDAESAGSEAKLADEDGGWWDCRLVGEGGEEGGYDVVNVGCEGSIPLFPLGVGVGKREVVEDVGGEEVWEFLYEALGE